MRLTILTVALLFGIIRGVPAFSSGTNNRQENIIADSARIYNNMGIERYRAGDFGEAAVLFKRSLEIKKREYGSLSLDMANTYSNLGVVSRRLNNTEEAMAYYDTAGYIIINYQGPDHTWLGAVYQNQGNILRDQRDVNSALAYYNNALRIFTNNKETGWVTQLYNNIGLTYQSMGSYEEAKEFFIRSIDKRKGSDPAGIALPAGNLAISYKETGDIVMADKYYGMALNVISENWGTDHVYYAINLMNYGLFLITSAGEPERGYRMLLRALEIHRSAFGEKGHHVARTYMNIGYYYELAGDYQSALGYQQRSLIANSRSFDSGNILDNPAAGEEVYSLDYMLTSLKHKAYSLYLVSGEADTRITLETSLATYKLAIEFIENIRMGQHTEESQMMLSENEHETYMQAIHVAWKLYELTEDASFLREAFIFSERSKAASLLSSMRNVEARSFGGVPEDLLENERALRRGIAAYRELVYEEQRDVKADTAKIAFWQERAFTLERDLRQLIASIEDEYPDYFALKYNQKVARIDDIMEKINPRDALISYVSNDSVVFIFAVTSRKAELYRIKPAGSAVEQVENLLDVLTSGNLDRRVRDDFNTFTASSRYLYNLLIEPAIEVIRNKRLIVVPDGILSYIPFELLLSSGPEPGRSNYKSLEYLFKDFAVSYNYSATLWQESSREEPAVARKMLALAPRYKFSEVPLPGNYSIRQYYRDRLTPLPGAREEAVRIAEMMNGEVLLDEHATESNFKQRAGDFQLLHLAMHTLIDDENPMFSKLVFSEPEDDQEDGFLNTYEIYNLRLSASLAVLSSCRSGFGTMRRGEGVMSLARGFLYAGVPSIVMTNWEIEDKSGAEIMITFYKYLLKGYRKDEALRQARLDFLENTDMLKAHPYFWGAYVCIGNPDEIFRIHRKFYPQITFTILLLIMVIVLWRGHKWALKG
jgi:CHAT domain-containing protein/Tfp pilus assembly protein PilF